MDVRRVVRLGVAALLVVHGAIHLLGAVKGFGWADVAALKEPISGSMGLWWLAAAVLLLGSAVLFVGGVGWWWGVGAAAVVVSQAVIFTSWDDAKAGTLANAVILLAALHGFAAQGPLSLRATYRSRVREARAATAPAEGLVTEADLGHLPAAVAGYVRRSGAVGLPRVSSLCATIHGRIRSGPDQPWMGFTGEQVNTFGPDPSRTFFLDAVRSGLPVDVLHRFWAGHARMQVRALSVIPVADASGPDLDRAETVTVLNDLCVLAPAALVDAPITWQELDAATVRATFTLAGRTVAADLTFSPDHDLVDFVSGDRLRASGDGRTFTACRWSTPIGGYQDRAGRRVATDGEAHWHAPSPEGEFSYLEFHLDRIGVDGDPGAGPDLRPQAAVS